MASIGRVSATLGISLVATLFALPASHAAKCTSWNIGNQPPGLQWGVRQSNGYIVGFVSGSRARRFAARRNTGW